MMCWPTLTSQSLQPEQKGKIFGGKGCVHVFHGNIKKHTLLCTCIYNKIKLRKATNWLVKVVALPTSFVVTILRKLTFFGY